MNRRLVFPVCLILTAPALGSASAQMPGIPGGAAGGMGMPDVSSIGVPNAAGVLSYCVKNKLLKSADASSVLGGLTGKPNVKTSPDYAKGETGTVLTGKDKTFSLNDAPKQVKSKVCDMVLKQGKSLI